MSEEKSHMAELASELLGAKLTSEIVREAWASASPDAKRSIAEALVARQIEAIKTMSSYDLNSVTAEIIRGIVKDIIESKSEEIRAEVNKRLEAQLPVLIDSAVNGITRMMRDAARDTLHAALRDALAKAPR